MTHKPLPITGLGSALLYKYPLGYSTESKIFSRGTSVFDLTFIVVFTSLPAVALFKVSTTTATGDANILTSLVVSLVKTEFIFMKRYDICPFIVLSSCSPPNMYSFTFLSIVSPALIIPIFILDSLTGTIFPSFVS